MISKKFYTIFCIFCISIVIFPFTMATSFPTKIKNNYFTNCHIEISGRLHNDWFSITKIFVHSFHIQKQKIGDDFYFLFGYTLFDKENLNLKIYDKVNGSLLYEPSIKEDTLVIMMRFKGMNVFNKTDENMPLITYNGECNFIKLIIRNFPWYDFE
jgi:hypothetical protein